MAPSVQVLGLLGSPRQEGNTAALLDAFLRGAREEGAETERVPIAELCITPCRGCDACFETGTCILRDDMDGLYPRLLAADLVVLASPIYFYGLTAWAKALVDRCQVLWARRYILKNEAAALPGPLRQGFFLSVGGTRGVRLFEGAILTARCFFDALHARYAGELVFRGLDRPQDALARPEVLDQAFTRGRRLVSGPAD